MTVYQRVMFFLPYKNYPKSMLLFIRETLKWRKNITCVNVKRMVEIGLRRHVTWRSRSLARVAKFDLRELNLYLGGVHAWSAVSGSLKEWEILSRWTAFDYGPIWPHLIRLITPFLSASIRFKMASFFTLTTPIINLASCTLFSCTFLRQEGREKRDGVWW